MRDIDMKWSTARATYDLIVDGEWYAEGTYEQMDDMARNIRQCEIEGEEYYGDDGDEGWEEPDDEYLSNAPCDNAGFCVGTGCSRYFECHK